MYQEVAKDVQIHAQEFLSVAGDVCCARAVRENWIIDWAYKMCIVLSSACSQGACRGARMTELYSAAEGLSGTMDYYLFGLPRQSQVENEMEISQC